MTPLPEGAPNDGSALGPGEEFDLIRRMRVRWGSLAPGLGDDAAVLRIPRGEQVVASTDAALELVHFRRDWLSYREIGYRAVTAALSDLAAMAATPVGILVALQLSDEARDNLDELADGIAQSVRAAKTIILGGNVARGNALGMTTTVLGSVHAAVARSTARPGDILYVTGRLGGTIRALRALRANEPLSAAIRERFAHPHARIAEARWLATRGAMAAIDISDGLASDAAHLAAASQVVVEIQSERVPVMEGSTVDDALVSGEEYELLLTARAPLAEAEFAERFGIPLTAIGRVSAGEPDVVITREGKRVATPAGYDHFSR